MIFVGLKGRLVEDKQTSWEADLKNKAKLILKIKKGNKHEDAQGSQKHHVGDGLR